MEPFLPLARAGTATNLGTRVKKTTSRHHSLATSNDPALPTTHSTRDPLLERVQSLLAQNLPSKALEEARTRRPRDLWSANAIGVCLMRLGSHEEAGRVLAEWVCQPESLVLRRETPTDIHVNFAEALLLGGDFEGCLRFLKELDYESRAHPRIDRLREYLVNWKRNLPWRAKLRSFCSGKVPAVTLPWPPGEILLPEHLARGEERKA